MDEGSKWKWVHLLRTKRENREGRKWKNNADGPNKSE